MAKKSKGGTNNPAPTLTFTTTSGPVNMAGRSFQTLSDADAQQIRDDEDDRYDASTKAAIKMYISNTNYDGKGHSLAQSLNYKLDNGIPLDVNEDYADRYMTNAMHDLGKDTVLQSGKHDDWLQALGIKDYTKMSQAQLQQALVGTEFDTKAHWSTSYDVNKNPFLSNSSGVSGGREVVYNIHAADTTKVVFGAKSQSEIVIGKGAHVKITGVRYTGRTAYPANGPAKPQIIIDVDVY